MSAVTSQPEGLGQLPSYHVTRPNGMVVRTMTYEDREFVADRLIEAFEGKVAHAVGKDKVGVIRDWKTVDIGRKQSMHRRVFIAEYEGEPAGVMVLKFYGDRVPSKEEDSCSEMCTMTRRVGLRGVCRLMCLGSSMGVKSVPQGHCYLSELAVDAKFRGKGVGRTLLEVGDEEAKRNNCSTIYLLVIEHNPAKRLYERHGYVEMGQLTGWMMTRTSGVRLAHKMVKDLS